MTKRCRRSKTNSPRSDPQTYVDIRRSNMMKTLFGSSRFLQRIPWLYGSNGSLVKSWRWALNRSASWSKDQGSYPWRHWSSASSELSSRFFCPFLFVFRFRFCSWGYLAYSAYSCLTGSLYSAAMLRYCSSQVKVSIFRQRLIYKDQILEGSGQTQANMARNSTVKLDVWVTMFKNMAWFCVWLII